MATTQSDPYSLEPEEAAVLEDEQVFLSKPINGKRKVSALLLSPPSSVSSNRSTTSASSASVHYVQSGPTAAFFELPEQIVSIATLELLGFTKKAAGDVYSRWLARADPSLNTDTILTYALSTIAQLNAHPLRDLLPDIAMTNIGIATELQSILVAPEFSQVFASQTPHFWVKDTMVTRYNSLKQHFERLKKFAAHTIAKRKEKKRPKIAGGFGTETSSSSSQAPQPPAASATVNLLTAGEDKEFNALAINYISVQTADGVMPDHCVLYKGKAVGEMNEDVLIHNDDGRISLSALQTFPGGDFNQFNFAWYWTPEQSTAEQYRRFAATRCFWTETWLIRVQVPKTWIDSLKSQQLWCSADWKEYVWHCKKSNNTSFTPRPQFDKFYKNNDFIRGHICGRSPESVPKIAKADVQTALTERDVLYVDGSKTSQVVFMNAGVVETMAQLVRGKMHIDVYAATNPPSYC